MATALVLGAAQGGLYVGDLLFVSISFLVLMLLVGKFAWKPVAKMMEDRRTKITNDLDGAAKARQEANELADKREKELQNTRAEATQIVNEARQNGEEQRQAIMGKAQNEAKNLKESAQRDAQQARIDALNSARAEVAQLSVDIASKLIGRELSAADQEDLINSYIKDLGESHATK